MQLVQCDLRHENGTTWTRAYIEEPKAEVGKFVTLKDSDTPEDRWEVMSTPNVGIDEKYLSELKVAYRKQRVASDI